MTTVVLAEKPSVARDLARVLGATLRRNGFYEDARGAYKVTWALGHLVQLAEPQDISAKWKSWRVLPILPDHFPLVPRGGSAQRAQLAVIERLFTAKRTDVIVCATDAGREGELIFRYICEYVFDAVPPEKKFMRLWASSLTDDAIREALRSMRPLHHYDRLAAAARLRSQLDWLVGMNGTRALAAQEPVRPKGAPCLTVGRVQTPTLAMIVARDEAIRTHVAMPYQEVHVDFAVREGTAAGGANLVRSVYVQRSENEAGKLVWERRLFAKDERTEELSAEAIAARARAGEAMVLGANRESKAYRPPLLFDLTSLQREANVAWGWTAQKTLTVAQELYEQHKLLSYPRTDSRHLSETVAATLPSVVAAIRPQHPIVLAERTGIAPLGKRFVDDARVSDHHAIIPTGAPARGLARDGDAYRLYDLVCRRLLGAWQDDAVEAVTDVVLTITTGALADRYHARGTELMQAGWRVLEPKPLPSPLPEGLRAGAPVQVVAAAVKALATQPPKHYTEATLLSAMESAGRELEGEAAEAMKERGLGTPATRAATIETLVSRGYVVRSGKSIHAAAEGQELVRRVHDSLRSPELTGDMEARLRRVERGTDEEQAFVRDAVALIEQLVAAHRGRSRAA
ncbi:MAG TPA: DNA topoisomerase [Polyangiales bacterium]|nr:DNA topoisomerase [Polyangiales bacterium]